MNQSLVKSAQILDILMDSQHPVSLTQFAKSLEMPKSTASRFLLTMEKLGFVRKDKDSGRYLMGIRLFELGCKAIEGVGLREAAVPEMELLKNELNENILLTIMGGTQVIYLDKVESQQAVVIQSNIGGSAPAYCVSSGKAMIAFDADRLEKVIGEGLKRFTANTITDPKKLRDTCQEIREKGYAINNGEYRIDAMGVGSPIFDSRNQVVGAISSVAPLSRMNKKQWRLHIESVLSTAERISQRLGKSQK